MANIILITGIQQGYIDEGTRPLATDIKSFLEDTDLEPVFSRFVNQDGSNFVKQLDWTEMFEPAETAIVEELQDHREESNTFTHHTYSALNADGIQECLEENDVERLYLCGIDTDAAVLDTAFHAFNTGMDVAVIQNLCGSTGGKELHRSALNIMERTIGNLVHSGELK